MEREGQAVPVVARKAVEGIVELLEPERVILFGSYARGQAGPGSDLDLLVVIETDEPPLEACIRVRRAARARCHGVPMDVLAYTPEELEARLAAGHPLLERILREGVALYAR